jgi:hypothetical protein
VGSPFQHVEFPPTTRLKYNDYTDPLKFSGRPDESVAGMGTPHQPINFLFPVTIRSKVKVNVEVEILDTETGVLRQPPQMSTAYASPFESYQQNLNSSTFWSTWQLIE